MVSVIPPLSFSHTLCNAHPHTRTHTLCLCLSLVPEGFAAFLPVVSDFSPVFAVVCLARVEVSLLAVVMGEREVRILMCRVIHTTPSKILPR